MLPALKECHSQDSGRLREHPLDEAAAQAAAPLGSRGRWQRAHDVGDDATARDGCLDQGVQLLVTADSQLQMARRDTLHLQILGGVARQLQHLQGEKGARGRQGRLRE